MTTVPGAKAPSAEHSAALDWSAAFVRQVDGFSAEDLAQAWNGDEAKGHRAYLKVHCPDLLRQLVAAVWDRKRALEPEPV